MQEQDNGLMKISKFAFWSIVEFVGIMAILNWIFSWINAPSDAGVAMGFSALALLVAGLIYQVLWLLGRPAEHNKVTNAQRAAAQAAAVQRNQKGNLLSDERARIFVPEGESPFNQEEESAQR